MSLRKFQTGMIQLYLILTLVIGAVGVGGFFYIKSLRSDLKLAEANQVKMEEALDAQKKVQEKMQRDIEEGNKSRKFLFEEIAKARQERDELNKKFTQSTATGKKRDFGNIAEKKPGLVENIVNKATQDSLRCNELASGSPLTEAERTGKVRNSICGNLIKEMSK